MNRNTHRILPVLVLLGLLTVGTRVMVHAAGGQQDTAQAGAPTYSRAYLHSYNLNSSGLALEGYCPVTYHTHNVARQGNADYAATYNGVDYHFVSAAAQRMFDRNPEKYIPAYGGWCAYGMAVQDKFPIDPTNFKVVNGRLMVFLRNEKVDALAIWNQNDEQDQVVKADAHWKKVSGG
jgi:YHS domain-containing protein